MIDPGSDNSKFDCVVTFFHDIEQDYDSDSDVDSCRNAVKEVLKIESKLNVHTTYNIVGRLFKDQPDLIETILTAGNETAFHSYNHQRDWSPRYFADEVRLCREQTSLPVGYRSPRSQWNSTTIKALRKNGFLWSAENDKNPSPYFLKDGLIRLPIAMDDWHLHTGRIDRKGWMEKFLHLLENRSYFAVGSHDFILSESEEYIENWERILETSKERNVLTLNFTESAKLFYDHKSGMNGTRDSESRMRKGFDRYWNIMKSEYGQIPLSIPAEKVRFNDRRPMFPLMTNSMVQRYRRLERKILRGLKNG